ncbi:MAG: (Fe-S)-binding protein, partial [Candidatus Bathyarchaeia archaeon]
MIIMEGKYQFVTLEGYKPALLTCVQCYCGLCVEGCPAYRATLNEAHSSRGLSQIALALLEGQHGLTLNDIPDELAYSCTGCRWCEWNCSLNTPTFIVEHGNRINRVSGATVAEIIRMLKVENGNVPTKIRDALNNLSKHGNPYGLPRDKKDKWVDSLGLRLKGQDTILYVGSLVPFEDRVTAAANALIEVLLRGGVSFGMVGGDELDSGAFARTFGEEGLFAKFVEHNMNIFKENKIKRIICMSPHDYDTFKNYYEDLKGVEIKHYTQVLWELMEAGKIKPVKGLGKKITYHDPCYLGRRQGVFDEPRKILKSIPQSEFIEIKGWT